ncbi:MAG: hypothetical protein HC888_16760 [Candidatus Competibacteraceae bacterium]|nr:hypothetical protein [Candidatus Competibacteraceae bacterium]
MNTLDVNDLLLESDPPGSVAATMNMVGASEGRYTVTLSGISGDGSIQLRVPAGFAVDKFGAQSLEAVSASRTVDNTPPQIVFDPPLLPESLGGPIVFQFSVEGAKTVPTPRVRLRTTGDVAGKVALVKLNSPAGTYHYQATISDYLGKGTVSIEVPGTGILDDVNNQAHNRISMEVEVGVYRVTVSASGQGTVMPEPSSFLYPADTILQLQAVPLESGEFWRWSIGGVDSFSTATEIVVIKNLKAHAFFSGSVFMWPT